MDAKSYIKQQEEKDLEHLTSGGAEKEVKKGGKTRDALEND